jgi:hypothetical protein
MILFDALVTALFHLDWFFHLERGLVSLIAYIIWLGFDDFA